MLYNRLTIIWKSYFSDKIKREFFRAVAVSVLLNGCTVWTLPKRLDNKLDGNYTRILRAVLKKVLEAALYKRVAVWPLTSNLTNHSSKTIKTF